MKVALLLAAWFVVVITGSWTLLSSVTKKKIQVLNPSVSARQRLFEGLKLREGESKTEAIFWDPQCEPCREEITRIIAGDEYSSDTVILHYYPLDIHPGSDKMAQTLARVCNPSDAKLIMRRWTEGKLLDFTDFDAALKGLKGLRSPAEAKKVVDSDIALANELKLTHTPSILQVGTTVLALR